MVLPLIPLAVAGGAGIAGGLVGGFLTGGKKGTVSEQHATKEHYAPVITDSRGFSDQRSWIYQIESPGASIDSKKSADLTSKPNISPSRTQEGGAGSTEGTDMTMLALIGAAGLVAYGVLK